LIKLIFAERGSDIAGEVWDRADTVVSNQLIYPEARAATAAARRGGRIDARTLRRAVDEIDDLYVEMHVIGIDDALTRGAGDLAEQHGLRGCDAVHLASAIAIDEPGLVVATWDRDLAAAALACGYPVVPRH
jgi:predicted nucleic acid-binding protein